MIPVFITLFLLRYSVVPVKTESRNVRMEMIYYVLRLLFCCLRAYICGLMFLVSQIFSRHRTLSGNRFHDLECLCQSRLSLLSVSLKLHRRDRTGSVRGKFVTVHFRLFLE